MKRLTALIAAAALLLAIFSGCGIVQYLYPDEASSLSGNMISFDDIEYIRPDMNEIYDAFDKASAAINKDKNIDKIINQLDVCYDVGNNFYTMEVLADIRSSQNINDSYYAGEYAFCLENEQILNGLYEQMYIECSDSVFVSELEKDYFEWPVSDYYGGEFADESEEYDELVLQESKLITAYRGLIAGMTVSWEGEDISYSELINDNLSDTEYQAVNSLMYKKYNTPAGAIYISLIKIRSQIADCLGYTGYEEYSYEYEYERDYTPEEAAVYLENIKKYIIPVYKDIIADDPYASVRYSELSESRLKSLIGSGADNMGEITGETFEFLTEYDLMDISSSAQKADISYQSYLYDYNAPYLFAATYGFNDDILIVAHEFGHCVDARYNMNAYESIDVSECFSQSMEFLLPMYLEDAVGKKESQNLVNIKLLDLIDTYAYQGYYAEFESRLYSMDEDELDINEINGLSLELSKEYGCYGAGYEEYFLLSWFLVDHFYEYPFYIISYCVSADAALSIYTAEEEKSGAGLDIFYKMLPRDHEKFLETLAQGGLESPFSEGRVGEIARLYSDRYGKGG